MISCQRNLTLFSVQSQVEWKILKPVKWIAEKNGSKKWLIKSNRSANKTNIWVFHINTRRHYWSSCLYWPLNIQLFVINLVIIYLEFTVNFRIGNASQLFYSVFENGISVAKIRLLAFYSGIPNVLCNSSSISDLIQQKQKPLIST